MVSHQPSSASATAASRRREQRPRLTPSRAEHFSQFSADASSYVRKDEYPIFAHTGDVEITIRGAIAADGVETVSNTYVLHQHILARCSGFFAASTSSQWSRAQTDPASGNERACDVGDAGNQNDRGSRRWKYELVHGTVWGDVPMLVQTDPLPATKGGSAQVGDSQLPSPSLSGPGSTTLNSLEPEGGSPATRNASQYVFDTNPDMREMLLGMDKFLLRNYDNLFRTFYNRRPMLENVNILRANIQCEFLLKLADQYDALAVVRTYVEHHLLQFQSSLWESVAVLTHWYLHVSCMLRSKVIFKEALIHLVGIWYIFQEKPQSQFDIPESILDTAQRKVHELEENVSRVESQLFRLSLTTVQGEDVTPANDYLGWLVVSLFRQWLATSIKSQTGPARNSESESGDGRDSDDENDIPPNLSICRVFRDIGSKSPSAYLDHHDCEEFLALNSQLYTRKNLADFERRMTELKFWARDLVRPLLRNNLELDVAKFNDSDIVRQDLTYFTCSTIEDSEFPWPLEPYIHYN